MLLTSASSSDSEMTPNDTRTIFLSRGGGLDDAASVSSISCGISVEQGSNHTQSSRSTNSSFEQEEEEEPSLLASHSDTSDSTLWSAARSVDAELVQDHASTTSSTDDDDDSEAIGTMSTPSCISPNSSFSVRQSMIDSSLSSLLHLLSSPNVSFDKPKDSLNTPPTTEQLSVYNHNSERVSVCSQSNSMGSTTSEETTNTTNTTGGHSEHPSSTMEVPIPRHELSSFLRVSRHLFPSESTANDNSTELSKGPTLENTNIINDILKALKLDITLNQEDTLLPTIPPTPPSLPPLHDDPKASHESKTDETTLKAMIQTHLPKDFICPICKDVIVGAVVLDCRCSASTCCMSCIETLRKEAHVDPSFDEATPEMKDETKDKDDDDDDDDFVLVQKPPTAMDRRKALSCPSCHVHYNNMVPCNPLDVAILNVVQNLKSSRETMELQRHFYQRLSNWRKQVLERHDRVAKRKEELRSILMKQLIQEEKEVLKRNRIRRKRWCVVREVTLFAAAAFVGINTLMRK